jgi:UDP-N-acetylglucosamine/UDP-N-acetylgalactosamine diphosphorylase
VILAGGQGSRLGFEYPKGMFNIGLKSGKSIFQILTERFVRVQQLAHSEFVSPKKFKLTNKPLNETQKCKLLIMTSNINHKDTVEFFETNNYFGAHPDSIVFFE